MALIPLKTNPTQRELRQFAGIWLPMFCLVLAAVAWAWYSAPVLAGVAAGAAIAIGAAGWAYPQRFRPLYAGWMIAVYPIGWVVGHVLLAVLFFAVITPIGWALRLFRHDPLQRRFDRQSDSYWQKRRPPPDDPSYFRQH